jgi:hypothetical protein
MTESTTAETKAHGVGLSDAAAQKVRSLLEQEGRDDLRLMNVSWTAMQS